MGDELNSAVSSACLCGIYVVKCTCAGWPVLLELDRIKLTSLQRVHTDELLAAAFFILKKIKLAFSLYNTWYENYVFLI